jgi:hypothetical protein
MSSRGDRPVLASALFGELAQLVERGSEKPGVAGSNPALATWRRDGLLSSYVDCLNPKRLGAVKHRLGIMALQDICVMILLLFSVV